jgi:hypothetical protein
MEETIFNILKTRGLPGGPNEEFTYITGVFSQSSPFDIYQAPSNIEGDGMFAGRPYKKGEMIGLAHQDGQPASELGKMHNHDENSPTMVSKKEGNQRYVYASKDLKKGDELTTNYRMQPELEQPEDFQKAQDGAEIKYPNLLDYSVDGVSGAAMKADNDIVSIARRWANNQTDGRRPALGMIDKLRSIFAGEDGCVNDNTCMQVVKEIVNEAAFDKEGQMIDGAPFIPEDIYNNRAFRKNFRDYGFEEVRPEDGGERFREDELQPGDIIQYYYNEDSPDVKEGDSYIGFPYHIGVYDKLDQYISDGDTFYPVMRNNMYTNEEGKQKDPFYVYRRKSMQDGGEPTFKYAIPGYDQKEFLKEWSNSPMGQKLLLESLGGNEKALERLTKKRTGNLDTVSINMSEDIEGRGRYRSNDHSILMSPITNGFNQVGNDYDSVLLHELSHSQDYTPGSQFNKLTIPLSDEKLIRDLSKDDIKNAKDRKGKKRNRYLADPTETRARLNVVRDTYEKFKEEDMPSVFDSEFTPSMLEEVKGTSQFEELQEIFSDEEIIQLLNTVAYQKGNKDFKGYAQLGGGVRNLIKKAGPKVMKYLDNLFSKTDDVVKSAPAIAKQKGLYDMLPIKKLDYPTHYGTIDIDDGTITNALDAMKAQGKYADDIGYSIDDLVGGDIQYLGDISGRTIVNVPLPNGKSQLFYKSTGLAGKRGSGVGGTSEGLWQPYGGHASVRGFPGSGYVENWFIKDSGYADYYGSESFKNIANKLDEIATEQGWDMSNQILKSNKKQFGGSVLKQLIKKGAIYLDDVVKRFSDDAGEFVSEIDWGKWNKEIPNNKPLMEEYATIEKVGKTKGTWMKNPDGSKFTGTPEQWVQVRSSNYQKAFPDGYQSVYRGVDGEDIKNYGPLGVNTNRTDIGPGIFTGDEIVASSYKGNPGNILNLAMKNSDNSLRLEGLGNWHADLNTIGASKEILKKNIDNLKREIKKLGKNAGDYNPNSASSKEARLESYENFYNNYDEIVSNPVYKRLVDYKKEVLEAGKKVKTAPGSNSFATDDLAVFLEREGLDNIQLRYVDDGMMGNTNISNQVPGNYLKSLQGNNGMFDMSNPDIYKQKGGEYDPYMDIDSTSQKRRTELTNAINKVVDSQGGDENLRALLTMTAFMENSLGANPDAYGRDYTRGAMSIDDIAFKNMFEKRKGARDYTTSQKKYFDWFENLGFDLENMDKHLRENVLANVAAARYQYGNAPSALPSKEDAEAMYKYYMDFYNRTDADHKDRFMKGYNAFIKQKQTGGNIEVMNLYKKYLMGGDTSKQGQMVYDKLNRLFYNDAKQSGMSPQNYIMTYLAGNS